jgi:4a-hydroxytetrahydrobiopterin dehydratase
MSSPLVSERCEACHAGAPRVSEADIAELAPIIPDWEIIEVKDVPRLRRTYTLDGWESALALTQAIGELATAEDHHPSIRTEWGKVTVTWWTHAIRGLHRNDFIMAAKSDAAFAQMT